MNKNKKPESKTEMVKLNIENIEKRGSVNIINEEGVSKRMLHEPDEEFSSCCFKCDKPLCLYIGKFSISVAVLLFCMFMLQNKANSAEFYTGTIAGLLGHYLNSPIAQLGNNKESKKKKE